MYNIFIKALNKIINIKGDFIFNNENLFDYLNKLTFKKIIKKLRAEEKQPKKFFKRKKVVIN